MIPLPTLSQSARKSGPPAPVLRRMLPTVPIILFTLHDNRTLQREAFSVGVSAVVSKAVGLKTLVNRAEDLLAATHR